MEVWCRRQEQSGCLLTAAYSYSNTWESLLSAERAQGETKRILFEREDKERKNQDKNLEDSERP